MLTACAESFGAGLRHKIIWGRLWPASRDVELNATARTPCYTIGESDVGQRIIVIVIPVSESRAFSPAFVLTGTVGGGAATVPMVPHGVPRLRLEGLGGGPRAPPQRPAGQGGIPPRWHAPAVRAAAATPGAQGMSPPLAPIVEGASPTLAGAAPSAAAFARSACTPHSVATASSVETSSPSSEEDRCSEEQQEEENEAIDAATRPMQGLAGYRGWTAATTTGPRGRGSVLTSAAQQQQQRSPNSFVTVH